MNRNAQSSDKSPCQTLGSKARLACLRALSLGAVVALTAGGCSTNAGMILVGTIPAADSVLADTPPTTTYANLAQKALSCWVGPQGPLKATHIFHAEAASPTAGGNAEIVLHERDMTSPHPWGQRAFRIQLADTGGGTNTLVTMQNIKLPLDLADAIRKDVVTWARGQDGCQVQALRPPQPDPLPAPANPIPAKTTKSKNG